MWSEARALSSSPMYCCVPQVVTPARRRGPGSSSEAHLICSNRNLPNRRQEYCSISRKFNPYPISRHKTRFLSFRAISAIVDDEDPDISSSATADIHEEQLNPAVEGSVKVLKNAAKTRKIPIEEVLSALAIVEKSKLDPSLFLQTLGGSKSPGRTWMLIFTAEKKLKGGRYFPLTAVQRFDAVAKRIENGVYLGPIGSLTFEGRLSWKKRILAFIFERIRIKVGPLKPLEISFGGKDNREPSNKDPFFLWFYVDEEIAVARGKGGGTAFWCRCHHASTH